MIGGASGDMLLGAMVSVGLNLDELKLELDKFHVSGFKLEQKQVCRGGLTAVLVDVVLDKEGQRTRTWDNFYSLIADSDIEDSDRQTISKIFDSLAVAESAAHGGEVGSTHLHELGTVDTLVDIAAAVMGMRLLGIEKLYASAFPVGIGQSSSSHGVMGATSAATAAIYLNAGAPVRASGQQPIGECVTPTGAAIVAALASFDPIEFTPTKIGYGAGQRNPQNTANVLGLWLAESKFGWLEEGINGRGTDVTLLETNIDDSSGEVLGYVYERLFEMGCLDVWFTPIQMKKNRPGMMLSALVVSQSTAMAAELIMKETSTLGVRVRPIQRYRAERQIVTVDTSLGKVSVKLKRIGDTIAHAAPEYESCRAIARETGMPLSEVMRVVVNEATMRGSPWAE